MTTPVPFAQTTDVAEFADIIVDSAVLMVDGVQLTISRGGWTFDPGEEWDDYSFPGKTMATVGARSLVRLKPTLKGAALLSGETQISAFRPDGTWSAHSTIVGARTFTPNALRSYLTDPDYLTNVICLWKRIRGDYIAVEFPYAVCGSFAIGSTDGDEGLLEVLIEAVQGTTGGTTRTRIPYRVRTVPTTPDPDDPEEPESEFGDPIDDRNARTLSLADGASVTVWGDDSTRSNPDAVPSTGDGQGAPTYRATGFTGGTPAVEFDGVNDGLRIASQITNGSFTQYFYIDAMTNPGGSGVGALWDAPNGYPRAKGITVLNTAVVGAPGGMGGYVNNHISFPTFENVVDTWGRGSPTVYAFLFDKEGGSWSLYADDMTTPVAGETCPPQFTESSVTWVGYEPGLAPVAFKLQREVTYDVLHDATQRAAIAAALIAGTLP